MHDDPSSKTESVENREPLRRPVPWNGTDVVLIFLLWIGLTVLCVRWTMLFSEADDTTKAPPRQTAKHPMTQLLEQGKERPVILLVAFMSGVVLAPFTEEMLFRLVFQGWLQKKRLLRFSPEEKTKHLSGVISIFIVSLVFAAMHGGQRTEQSTGVLFYGVLGLAIANFLSLCLVSSYLAVVRGADKQDLGFPPGHMTTDLLTGVGAFFVCGPAILCLNSLLRMTFPNGATDPIPLFLFSVVLGTLYYRTGRLLPGIAMHACLNSFSFWALVLSS